MAKPSANATAKPMARLASLDLARRVPRDAYKARLARAQQTLQAVQQAYLSSGDSAVIVFEGWDAAGKGGTIRRLSAPLDPRGFKVWPIGAPRDYHRERHYLQRFWEKLPPRGGIAAFDRSWYGRVLVERVEALAPPGRWRAAYDEINDFERALVADGARVVKVFLHISKAEQLRRFEARLLEPRKRWKLSYEDFRNRARWTEYMAAAEEMFARTEAAAPWTVLAAEQKRLGRIEAIETVAARLSDGVDLAPRPLERTVLEAAREHLELTPEALARLPTRAD